MMREDKKETEKYIKRLQDFPFLVVGGGVWLTRVDVFGYLNTYTNSHT